MGLRHMSPFVPAIVPSLNQMGFDSLHFLGRALYTNSHGGQVVLLVGAQPDGATRQLKVDSQSLSRIVLNVKREGSAVLMTGTHFRMVTGGPVINADNVRIGTSLDATRVGHEFVGTNMIVETSCLGQGVIGLGLLAFGICNPSKELEVSGTIAGANVSYPVGNLPQGTTENVSGFKVGGITETTVTIHAQFTPPLRAHEHLAHIVLVDASTGLAVDLDYTAQNEVLKDSTGNLVGATLTLPFGKGGLEKGAKAFFVVDLDIVAVADLPGGTLSPLLV